jgi:biotin-dependent carboxylase-like uncharacterized protein
MTSVTVLAPGGYTTVQDRGRFGFQNMGIPVSGVLDTYAAAAANLLVGNPESSALLELTVMGPTLEIHREMDIALTGADMGIRINGTPAGQWRSLRVRPGDRVEIGQVRSGCRACLAFGGGIRVPPVMGSLSTYAGGKIGGFQGRPLRKDDIFDIREAPLLSRERVTPAGFVPSYPTRVLVRAIPGPQADFFDSGHGILFGSEWMVTAKADRMGYRLKGTPVPIREGMPGSIVSEPSMPGSIQIPADGQPIVLLVEQTVGGYAKIATIISSDIARVAQATPGDTLGFESVDLDTAHAMYREEKKRLIALKERFEDR